jgi:predicted esterase
MDLEKAKGKFSDTELILALGDKDEIITSEHIQKQEELISGLGKEVKRFNYSGGHDINPLLLEKIINR